jgi:hypothetical protein
MRSSLLLAGMLLPALVACESVDSSDVLTSGMYADLTAQTEGEGTRATATLRVGGGTSNTFVRLGADDQLTVNLGETTLEMEEVSLGELYSYIADFDTSEPGSTFNFAFNRVVDAGAPASTATLPEPFTLTGPQPDAVFSRTTQDISVTWENSNMGDPMEVRITGDCIMDATLAVAQDSGSFLIDADTLESFDGTVDQACDATISVYRRRPGTLDVGFGEGGLVYGSQLRTVKIRLDP